MNAASTVVMAKTVWPKISPRMRTHNTSYRRPVSPENMKHKRTPATIWRVSRSRSVIAAPNSRRQGYGARGDTEKRKRQVDARGKEERVRCAVPLLHWLYYGAHKVTLLLSPFDGVVQMVNVPGSLPAVYKYTLQPDGSVGTAAKNGPASCPWAFLT